MRETMAEVVAERKTQMLPGRMFAEAYAADGFRARVEYDVTITDSLTSSRRKRRYPARNMMKIVDLSRNPQRFYWHESPPEPGDPDVTEGGMRRELAHRFHRSPVPELLATTAWVQVPDGLCRRRRKRLSSSSTTGWSLASARPRTTRSSEARAGC